MRILLCLVLGGSLLAGAKEAFAEAENRVLWTMAVGEFCFDSSAAIGPDGTIYTAASFGKNGTLNAITPAGVKKWSFRTGADIRSSPAVGADGTVYFGGRDRNFYALGPDGAKKWSALTGGWVDSSPALARDGTICFGGWDGTFYALKPDGGTNWTFKTGGPIDSSPAIGADGTIYFGSHDQYLYALDARGAKKWGFHTDGAIISSPALDAEGAIYFTSVDGRLYVLHPDGTEKWRLWTGGVGDSSPVVDPRGDVYLGVNHEFLALKAGGIKKWGFGFGEYKMRGAAVVAADGTIFFGCDAGNLYAFNPDGTIQFVLPLGGAITSSPAMTHAGTLYLGAEGGRLCAIKGNAELAQNCWAKFHGDPAQTGRANLPAE